MDTIPFELFLSDEVQTLMDDFAALLELRVTFYSATGERLRRGKEMRNSGFCELIQNDLGQLERCFKMDQNMREEGERSRKICNYRCHAGLHECLAPVFVREKLAGFLMFGQFRLEGEKPPDIPVSPKMAKKMQHAFYELPCFSEEKLNSIIGMLHTLIDYIAVRELAVLQTDRLRSEIDSYIQNHATEDLRLPDMARKLGKSVSTISQFLRRNYQTSFKELLLETRLKLAEHFWRKNPDATVSEAAYAAGFSDQFYFSRVFRNRRGIPPGEFRNSMRLIRNGQEEKTVS